MRLTLRRELGAGNFFWHVCDVATDLDRAVLFRSGDLGPRGWSVAELRDEVLRYADWYRERGVGVRTRVGVWTADGLAGLLHHIAITSLGGVTVLTNPNMAPETAARYFERSDTAALVGDADLIAALPGPPPVVADLAQLRAHPGRHRQAPYRHAPDDLVLISHSSGTTGTPKPTAFAHRSFFVGKRERLWRFPSSVDDRVLTALPHSHSSGISYLSLALLLGLPAMLVDDPAGASVAAAMNEFLPTVVIGFPLALADLPVDRLSERAKDTVHTWMGMGDASHERHIRPLVRLGRNGSTYLDGLGSSEMGMVLFRQAHTRDSERYGRAIGRPVPVVREAAVLDERGNALPDGQAGLLGVRTPSLTPGYVNEPGLTRQARRGDYFLTGDVVRRDADGVWYHLDRTPDVITTSRGPVHSLELEEVVLNTTGAFDAAVIAVDDPAEEGRSLPVAVVLHKDEPPTPEDALARCNAALAERGLATLAGLVVAADRTGLPVGVTGKVLKRQLRERHQKLLGEPVAAGVALAGPVNGR
ncbi:class I adenylate-forming enzyme family protein [Saccharothrix obliqua]|uniref:class I adenylate-forming enzyme family protein n=1 Tax=Saccharothrix obliqua TaxID=2861747 RepID=UPI001C5DC57C|nr:class I adenylate-forming enzyme family protein [Saccharothrix obliqua]MBW4717536.1 acyl--CoA ligase [Saccharothrix obliqua]